MSCIAQYCPWLNLRQSKEGLEKSNLDPGKGRLFFGLWAEKEDAILEHSTGADISSNKAKMT